MIRLFLVHADMEEIRRIEYIYYFIYQILHTS